MDTNKHQFAFKLFCGLFVAGLFTTGLVYGLLGLICIGGIVGMEEKREKEERMKKRLNSLEEKLEDVIGVLGYLALKDNGEPSLTKMDAQEPVYLEERLNSLERKMDNILKDWKEVQFNIFHDLLQGCYWQGKSNILANLKRRPNGSYRKN